MKYNFQKLELVPALVPDHHQSDLTPKVVGGFWIPEVMFAYNKVKQFPP